jgi:hypothetical protein
LKKIFSSNLLDDLSIRDDSPTSASILARMQQFYPKISERMLAHLSDTFKTIPFNKTVTFPSLGEEMIKFAIDFGLIITIGKFPSIVPGLQFKRNLAHLNGLIIVHIKQAIHQDLIRPIQPLVFLIVISNTHHEHPNLLDELDLTFATETGPAQSFHKAAHYFVRIEIYHRFVFCAYDVDQDQPTTNDFQEVHDPIFMSTCDTPYIFSFKKYKNVVSSQPCGGAFKMPTATASQAVPKRQTPETSIATAFTQSKKLKNDITQAFTRAANLKKSTTASKPAASSNGGAACN